MEKAKKEARRDALLEQYHMVLLEEEHCLVSEQYFSPYADESGRRPVSTMFGMYCHAPESFSYWHRLTSEEIWTFLEGDPIELWMEEPVAGKNLSDDAQPSGGHFAGDEPAGLVRVVLGPDAAKGQVRQAVVPRGVAQAGLLAEGGVYALFSCAVVPAFSPEIFSLVDGPDIGFPKG